MNLSNQPIPEEVRVVNGTAKVGDTIAVAVREGNFAELRYGEIVEFAWTRTAPIIKLRITKESSFGTIVGKTIRITGHYREETGIMFERAARISAATVHDER